MLVTVVGVAVVVTVVGVTVGTEVVMVVCVVMNDVALVSVSVDVIIV